MRATALEDLLGVPWKEPMPQLMGNGEIFKSLIAVLGRVDDGAESPAKMIAPDTPFTSAGFA
jgi:hypothetical protein